MVPPCGPLKQIIDALAKAGEVRPHWNENNELECISFATREQIDLFQRFLEVVGIDATYNTIRSRYLSLSTWIFFTAIHFFRSLRPMNVAAEDLCIACHHTKLPNM